MVRAFWGKIRQDNCSGEPSLPIPLKNALTVVQSSKNPYQLEPMLVSVVVS